MPQPTHPTKKDDEKSEPKGKGASGPVEEPVTAATEAAPAEPQPAGNYVADLDALMDRMGRDPHQTEELRMAFEKLYEAKKWLTR